jgi:hypothetical protein
MFQDLSSETGKNVKNNEVNGGVLRQRRSSSVQAFCSNV